MTRLLFTLISIFQILYIKIIDYSYILRFFSVHICSSSVFFSSCVFSTIHYYFCSTLSRTKCVALKEGQTKAKAYIGYQPISFQLISLTSRRRVTFHDERFHANRLIIEPSDVSEIASDAYLKLLWNRVEYFLSLSLFC